MSDESRLIGFTALHARACFRARGVEISFRPFTCANCSGSFPRARAPPQSSFALFSRPCPFGRRLYCQGLFPRRDITGDASTHLEEFPSPRYVPSAGALNLSTAFSALRLLGLFHPRAASRVLCSFRGLPSPRSDRASSVRSAPLPLRSPAAHQDESWCPRLAPSASRP